MAIITWAQSQLFGSPYSGCRKFSGWKPGQCIGIASYPLNSNSHRSPGPIMCVDKHRGPRPVYQVLQRDPTLRTRIWTNFIPAYGNPPDQPYDQRAIQTTSIVPYKLRPIAGPSASGPFTYFAGLNGGDEQFNVGGIGAMGHNQGLT